MKKEIIKNELGITLTSLVVTVIILMIITSIATYSGVEVIRMSRVKKFTTELEILQSQINSINGEKKIFDEDDGEVIEKDSILQQELMDRLDIVEEYGYGNTEEDIQGYKFFTPEELTEDLNIEGVSQSVFINLEKKKAISLDGVKYRNEKIYVLEQAPSQLYLVKYSGGDPGKEPDQEQDIFHLDAMADIEYIESFKESADFNIIVNNYIDTSVSSYDTTYTVTIKENDVFTINEIEPRIIKGKTKNDDVVKITLTSIPGANLHLAETITILVISTDPEDRIIEIPLNIYTVEYEEYNITYEVKMGNDTIKTAKDNINGITLDSIFGSDRLTKIVNFSYLFNVTITPEYEARVYCDGVDITHGFSLGTEPEYVKNGDRIEASSGPSSLILDDTFFYNNVQGDKHIVVELENKFVSEGPKFNASLWTDTEGARERGTSGIYKESKEYDIEPFDNSWNWNIFGEKPQPMIKQDDGTYSINWTFQTNKGSGTGFLLDSLQINGVAITIPFVPGIAENIKGLYEPVEAAVGRGNAGTYTITELPSGAKVKVEYIKVFNNGQNNCNQRVYGIEVTGARSNVTVTGGNIMMFGDGAPEVVIYSLKGVEDVKINNISWQQADIVVKKDDFRFDEIKFKLKDYYEKPKAKFTTKKGIVLENKDGSTIKVSDTPDENGYYTITNIPSFDLNKIALLNINATPIRYAIQYNSGEIADARFTNWYDDNNQDYYTTENAKIVRISNQTPIDPKRRKVFRAWKNGNDFISVGQVLDFQYVAKHAVLKKDGVYALDLEARWK